MKKFELLIENKKLPFYERFFLFLALMNLAAFMVIFITANNTTQKYLSGFSMIVMLAGLILDNYNKKKQSGFANGHLAAMAVTVIVWGFLHYWWFAALILLLTFLYFVSKRRLAISVTGTVIEYPSFPKRIIQWSQLSNVVLKDGLLTIDFKSNRLIQVDIVNEINEPVFNEFCKTRLLAVGSK
jgi:hypothetical protein